jgi:hypothetical protein
MVSGARLARSLALPLALGSLAGCAQVLDLPDSSTLSLAPSGPWRCLDAPSAPAVPSSATATIRFQACDFLANCTLPVSGLHARLCDKLDVGCLSPRQPNIQDKGGLVEFAAPTGSRGFDGYLEVSPSLAPCYDRDVFGDAAAGLLCHLAPGCDPAAPTVACNVPIYSPALWFFNPPIVADVETPIPLELYPSASLPLILDAAGGSLAPGTGSVFMSIADCDGNPASGVSLQVAEHGDVVDTLYFDSGVLSNTATATDSSGLGGFIRVPPGFVEITAFNSDGVPVAKVGVQSRAYFVTLTTLTPNVPR